MYWETNCDKAPYILDISEDSGLVLISIRFLLLPRKKKRLNGHLDWTLHVHTIYQSMENSQIKQECYNISLQTIQWKLKYNLARFELKFHWKYNLHVRTFWNLKIVQFYVLVFIYIFKPYKSSFLHVWVYIHLYFQTLKSVFW